MAPAAADAARRHPPADRDASCLHLTSLVLPSCVSIRHASLRTSASNRLLMPSISSPLSPLAFCGPLALSLISFRSSGPVSSGPLWSQSGTPSKSGHRFRPPRYRPPAERLHQAPPAPRRLTDPAAFRTAARPPSGCNAGNSALEGQTEPLRGQLHNRARAALPTALRPSPSLERAAHPRHSPPQPPCPSDTRWDMVGQGNRTSFGSQHTVASATGELPGTARGRAASARLRALCAPQGERRRTIRR